MKKGNAPRHAPRGRGVVPHGAAQKNVTIRFSGDCFRELSIAKNQEKTVKIPISEFRAKFFGNSHSILCRF